MWAPQPPSLNGRPSIRSIRATLPQDLCQDLANAFAEKIAPNDDNNLAIFAVESALEACIRTLSSLSQAIVFDGKIFDQIDGIGPIVTIALPLGLQFLHLDNMPLHLPALVVRHTMAAETMLTTADQPSRRQPCFDLHF